MYLKSISTNLILEYSQVGKAAEFDFVIVGSSPTTLKAQKNANYNNVSKNKYNIHNK